MKSKFNRLYVGMCFEKKKKTMNFHQICAFIVSM